VVLLLREGEESGAKFGEETGKDKGGRKKAMGGRERMRRKGEREGKV